MKIRELYIEGFGHFHDRHIGPFLSPIVVFHGPNEAGKSTLLAFIRTILFGFPARNRDKHYPPLASGGHGGRIAITDDAGKEYVIERFAGARGGPVHIRDDAGAAHDEAVLTKMLGNASQDMFTNVFAFSLEELQTGDLLEDTHINGQIYSAGLGAAKLPQALVTLKARREAIFRSRGRTQIISDLMTELQKVDAQLDNVRGNAAQYSRLAARRDDIDTALARMHAEQSSVLARRGAMSKLEEAWEDWIDFVSAEERLKDIPHFDGFPTDSMSRLEQAEQRVRTSREEVQAAREQLAQADAAANTLIHDMAMLGDREAIAQINRGRHAFDGSIRDLPERKAELRALEESLARRLHNLGVDWDEHRLEAFDLSLAFRNHMAHWQQRLAQRQEQVREARHAKAQAEQHVAEQHAFASEARRNVDAAEQPVLTSSQIEERRMALRTSRTRRGEYDRLWQRHADLRYQLESLAHDASESQSPVGRHNLVLQVFLALNGCAFLGFGAILGTQALLLGAVAAAVAFGVASYLCIRGRSAQPAAPNVRLRSLRHLVHSAAEEEAEAMRRFQEAARLLSLDLPDAAALDEVEAELVVHENSLRTWSALNERLEQMTRHVQRQERRFEEAMQRCNEAEAAAQQEQEAWQRWLSDHTLPTSLMPETMNEFVGLVEATRLECDQVQGMRHRVAAIEVDIQEYQDVVQPLAHKYAIEIGTDHASHMAIVADRLIERFEKARDEVAQRNAAHEDAEQARRRYERRETQLQEAEEALQGFLRAVGAESPEALRLKAAQYAERMALEQQRHESRLRLQRLSGPGDAFESFRAMLAQTHKQGISDEVQQLAEQSSVLEHQRQALLEERGSVETLIRQLSDEEESSALRVRHNLLIEQLREAARKWSKLRLAEELLHRARQKFEQERQPSVIQHAQRFFTLVTNHRYERLFAPIGEQTITVTETTGREKYPSDLSRGTREQLYLALRFGLIREFGEHAESLPVVVDEILVNFDPDRAQRAAQAFADLAQTNQILVFTCHPPMIDTFVSAYAETQIINVG